MTLRLTAKNIDLRMLAAAVAKAKVLPYQAKARVTAWEEDSEFRVIAHTAEGNRMLIQKGESSTMILYEGRRDTLKDHNNVIGALFAGLVESGCNPNTFEVTIVSGEESELPWLDIPAYITELEARLRREAGERWLREEEEDLREDPNMPPLDPDKAADFARQLREIFPDLHTLKPN
jgi:hypothetical protein